MSSECLLCKKHIKNINKHYKNCKSDKGKKFKEIFKKNLGEEDGETEEEME